jgi:hypothetical protein
MDLIFPTERQAVRALLNAVANHRDVKNAEVYFPVLVGDSAAPQKVPLVSFRTFGGTEYIEDGLTLAIYPVTTGMGLGNALVYRDRVLGNVVDPNYCVQAKLKLVVQLFYRETTYNAPLKLYSDSSSLTKDIVRLLPYGELIKFKEDRLESTPLAEQLPLDRFVNENIIEVNVLPGEEVLRDWMAILRGVIRDLPLLQPFAMRNPNITLVEYQTSNWLKPEIQNLVFHSAYMVVEYDLFEPARCPDYRLPSIGENLSIENSPVADTNPPPPPLYSPPLIDPPPNDFIN